MSKALKLNNKVVSKINEELVKSINGTSIMPGKSQGETWVIDERPTIENTLNETINFVSNNNSFSSITLNKVSLRPFIPSSIYYNSTKVWMDAGTWNNEAYRTITFETAPTGDLLAWLQANGRQQ